tara:strand:+ start:462 stop:680 length:219 start_codon:yes stop_codon:yes gene_type:complete
MTEDKKVITIDDIEYTEDQLSDEAKGCINHIQSLDQKIGSAQFNLTQLQGGREFFMARLKAELETSQDIAAE